ncbi:hypothetical protein, partial [Thalassobacillus sp. C254]|uniref:hypothetical protein n=1 Tax=Thalassobacillus sp. C254 TaxID=1225341 RepID=UPI0012EED507
ATECFIRYGFHEIIDRKSNIIFLEFIRKVLMEWLRRRLRMIRWKEWKLPKTKVKNLMALGVTKAKALEWGNTRKGYWRIASSPILHRTLNDHYWQRMGLKSLN